MTVRPMRWTTKENVRVGKTWYIVDRTLTTTHEPDKDDWPAAGSVDAQLS